MADEAMRLNMQLAHEVRESGATLTLDDLDRRVQEPFKPLEDSGVCRRGEPVQPSSGWRGASNCSPLK
jgi:hypothetical protein